MSTIEQIKHNIDKAYERLGSSSSLDSLVSARTIRIEIRRLAREHELSLDCIYEHDKIDEIENALEHVEDALQINYPTLSAVNMKRARDVLETGWPEQETNMIELLSMIDSANNLLDSPDSFEQEYAAHYYNEYNDELKDKYGIDYALLFDEEAMKNILTHLELERVLEGEDFETGLSELNDEQLEI